MLQCIHDKPSNTMYSTVNIVTCFWFNIHFIFSLDVEPYTLRNLKVFPNIIISQTYKLNGIYFYFTFCRCYLVEIRTDRRLNAKFNYSLQKVKWWYNESYHLLTMWWISIQFRLPNPLRFWILGLTFDWKFCFYWRRT